MKTIISPVGEESLRLAGKLLREGQVVAFPTETVYGLGAWAMSPEGIRRIYEAKGRPSDNPLIVHVAPGMDLSGIAASIPEKAKILMDRFWPGPMTLIFPKGKDVLPAVTGGLETVAIRMPSHPVAMELIKSSGMPIVAPSANTSGRPSPTTAQHVLEDMDGRIPLILDGGACSVGLESTIVDLTEDVPMILRPGAITLEMLEEAIGEVRVDPAVQAARSLDANVRPKAPGMKYRHYAPKGRLILTDHPTGEITGWLLADLKGGSEKIGLIGTRQWIDGILAGIPEEERETVLRIDLGEEGDTGTIAASLFDGLRQADELGLTLIYGEAFKRSDLGEAIMNRFLKASSERRIINL